MTGLRTIAIDTLRAMAFLSRLPVPSRFFNGYDGTLARISGTAPLVGALLALPSALLVGLVQAGGGDALTGALLAVALMVLITGALHEDGLADCADGMGGGRDREHALAIMKDSHIGAYGVVALVLSLALRASALAALCRDLPAPMAGLILIAVAAASRAAMVWHWHALPPARSTGVASGAGRPDGAALGMALVIAAILAGPLCLLAAGPAGLLGAIVACVLATGLFTARVSRRLAGHTGDTIGASQQIAETAMLSALALLA